MKNKNGSVLIALITIVLVVLIILGVKNTIDNTKYETKPIKSMILTKNIENSANGMFVLGIGTYSSNERAVNKYYFYYKASEGFKLGELSINNVEIVETNELEPSIKGNFRYGEINQWDKYILYVPIGTIYENYSANINELK